jgi:hypothetical protein
MPEPKSVTVRVKYNRYIHKCRGFVGTSEESTKVVLLPGQLPKGYTAEHIVHGFEIIYKTHCLEADPSGESEWIATELLDLDGWASGGRM